MKDKRYRAVQRKRKLNGFAAGAVLGSEVGGMSAGAGVWSQYGGEGEDALRREQTNERDEAFAALVARHSRLMFRVAYSLLRNAHDAEDTVQETLLKLYRGESWRAMEDERAFLARTVWRMALDRLPSAGRSMEDVTKMELASDSRTPEQSAVYDDERVLLRQLIEGLPEDLRQALLLSAIEEMSSPEVAALLGVPEGTVRTRVMRAKAELKRRFEAMNGGPR